ncbi:MAG TPA: metalloregulator ArsR/SmtB family transcription factor [Tenuifilaceae bacterium]|jgi:DNA-binding transcriptional ArsR family regulator|nr:helix-turn-helix transcriptional regulator [Bacteroidales bacterium]HNT42403.1 metalloregulator ArsR/SmtB family transcription factor [Tenuifilaceae bacterium]MBP8643360.1 helix-turn-helix transcriptional regulator [Bacteroidales bacterium]NLI87319.1 helix-turn-helix transcriptional regulator [Bacteroidales bacterium]HNY08899.1 metalloregulator ArsR/SmtB family transcription factor [Tenuifilaceae bacterium]
MVKINELKVEQLEDAANMLKAMAHPMRIAIISLLEANGRLTVTQIHEKLQIEQSTASHHLGILKDKGLLACKREGKNNLYFLRNENLGKILDCVGSCTSTRF